MHKAIQSAEPAAYTLKGLRTAPVLGPYKPVFEQLTAENERMPWKQCYMGHKIFELLQAPGYAGSEPSVRRNVAPYRQAGQRHAVYVLDELGYIPFSPTGAHLMCQFCSSLFGDHMAPVSVITLPGE